MPFPGHPLAAGKIPAGPRAGRERPSVRVAFPRMRADQLQKLAWQGLVPVALLQLAITGIGVVLFY